MHFDKVDSADEDIELLHDDDGKELRPVGGLALAAASVRCKLDCIFYDTHSQIVLG